MKRAPGSVTKGTNSTSGENGPHMRNLWSSKNSIKKVETIPTGKGHSQYIYLAENLYSECVFKITIHENKIKSPHRSSIKINVFSFKGEQRAYTLCKRENMNKHVGAWHILVIMERQIKTVIKYSFNTH